MPTTQPKPNKKLAKQNVEPAKETTSPPKQEIVAPTTRTDKKNTIIIILTAIVILLTVALIGFVVITRNAIDKSTTSTNNTITAPDAYSEPENSQSDPSYLWFNDFRVRIPLDKITQELTLGGVEKSTYSSEDSVIAVLAPQLDKGWSCEPASNDTKASIGSISISKDPERAGPYTSVVKKKIGDYTFGFEEIKGDCAIDADLYQQLVGAFKVQFEKMESF